MGSVRASTGYVLVDVVEIRGSVLHWDKGKVGGEGGGGGGGTGSGGGGGEEGGGEEGGAHGRDIKRALVITLYELVVYARGGGLGGERVYGRSFRAVVGRSMSAMGDLRQCGREQLCGDNGA